MVNKKKLQKQTFNPKIYKTKLNYEQAVLACSCYDTGWIVGSATSYYGNAIRCTRSSGGTKYYQPPPGYYIGTMTVS